MHRLVAGSGGVFVCDQCVHRLETEFAAGHDGEPSTTDAMLAPDQSRGLLGKWVRSGDHAGDSDLRCSFCGKGQDQVSDFYAGLNGVQICYECIDLCQEIISEEATPRGGTPTTEELLSKTVQRNPSCYFCGSAVEERRVWGVYYCDSEEPDPEPIFLWECHGACLRARIPPEAAQPPSEKA